MPDTTKEPRADREKSATSLLELPSGQVPGGLFDGETGESISPRIRGAPIAVRHPSTSIGE